MSQTAAEPDLEHHDVAAAALQLGAQLPLREAAGVAQAAQIVAKIAIPP